jgi:ABC-type multidrug transport system fused ATPase/permease subunit
MLCHYLHSVIRLIENSNNQSFHEIFIIIFIIIFVFFLGSVFSSCLKLKVDETMKVAFAHSTHFQDCRSCLRTETYLKALCATAPATSEPSTSGREPRSENAIEVRGISVSFGQVSNKRKVCASSKTAAEACTAVDVWGHGSAAGATHSSTYVLLYRGLKIIRPCLTCSVNLQVLSGVNLSVERGSFHLLLGPNGCGKSTLLKVLGGLIHPQEGSFSIDEPVGFVFQNPDHQVIMPTVGADVAFGLGR